MKFLLRASPWTVDCTAFFAVFKVWALLLQFVLAILVQVFIIVFISVKFEQFPARILPDLSAILSGMATTVTDWLKFVSIVLGSSSLWHDLALIMWPTPAEPSFAFGPT